MNKRFEKKKAPDPDYWPTLIEKLVIDMWVREPNFTLDQLKNIENPSLIIIGEKEEFYPLESNQEMADVMPNARLEVIPGATHFAPIEKPEPINKLIIDFLKEE